ncbi:hypothetical protein STAQ_15270 [Allostella sp. ATCC 35155]|nr:hypothetical protein STAQ_15270 [Stella sp. ATCC 35155]
MSQLTIDASTTRPGLFLRRALQADAAVSAASGLLMALAAGPLSGLLGLPAALLLPAGIVLLPYAALLLWLAGRPVPSAGGVWLVIAANVLWAIDCVLVLVAGWFQPTGLGVAFVAVQAVTVLLFAELQYIGLRRIGR